MKYKYKVHADRGPRSDHSALTNPTVATSSSLPEILHLKTTAYDYVTIHTKAPAWNLDLVEISDNNCMSSSRNTLDFVTFVDGL